MRWKKVEGSQQWKWAEELNGLTWYCNNQKYQFRITGEPTDSSVVALKEQWHDYEDLVGMLEFFDVRAPPKREAPVVATTEEFSLNGRLVKESLSGWYSIARVILARYNNSRYAIIMVGGSPEPVGVMLEVLMRKCSIFNLPISGLQADALLDPDVQERIESYIHTSLPRLAQIQDVVLVDFACSGGTLSELARFIKSKMKKNVKTVALGLTAPTVDFEWDDIIGLKYHRSITDEGSTQLMQWSRKEEEELEQVIWQGMSRQQTKKAGLRIYPQVHYSTIGMNQKMPERNASNYELLTQACKEYIKALGRSSFGQTLFKVRLDYDIVVVTLR